MHGSNIGGNIVRLGYAKVPAREGVVGSGRPDSQVSDYMPMPAQRASGWQDSHHAVVGTGSSASGSGSFEHQEYTPRSTDYEHSSLAYNTSPASEVPASQTGDEFSYPIPELPEPRQFRRVDQNRLREMRRKLDSSSHGGSVSMRDLDAMFAECEEEFVELSTGTHSLIFTKTQISESAEANPISSFLLTLSFRDQTTLATLFFKSSSNALETVTASASFKPSPPT